MWHNWIKYLKQASSPAPLVVFRILFGCLMVFTTVRFVANGWVEKFYVEPQFFFKYYGFDFVKSLGYYTYLLFLGTFISGLGIMLGYYYRISAIIFFLCFTYIELIEKTVYLNHYYFISLISFLLIFLPANCYFSIDARRCPQKAFSKIPRYYVWIIPLLLCIVYFYAGLAKLNSDWLFKAMPLAIWLPAKYDIPILGDWLQMPWVHYFFSWAGMFYDLSIPFLLIYKRTRVFAFFLVIVFHVLTRVLFPIGIFPYIMIFATLVFFSASFHEKIIFYFQRILKIRTTPIYQVQMWRPTMRNTFVIVIFCLFFFIQILFPFRYLLYPNELFWTEEGYRFSWRVMLMEKAGYTNFKVLNPKTDKWFYVINSEFLTPLQEKQMNSQPDFILQYAHFLEQHYQSQGIATPEIYVESYVALNGRKSQAYIDPKVDLTKLENSFAYRYWILPFKDTIYGF